MDLLAALLLGGPAKVLGLHPPPIALDHNASPSAILLGHPWPQGIVSSTTVIFLNNLGHQLPRIGNIHINLRHNSSQPRLSLDAFNGGEFMFEYVNTKLISKQRHSSRPQTCNKRLSVAAASPSTATMGQQELHRATPTCEHVERY